MCQLQLSLFKLPSKAERILLEALPWLDFYKYLGSLIKIKKYQISYPIAASSKCLSKKLNLSDLLFLYCCYVFTVVV
jgi:hypothetical protein